MLTIEDAINLLTSQLVISEHFIKKDANDIVKLLEKSHWRDVRDELPFIRVDVLLTNGKEILIGYFKEDGTLGAGGQDLYFGVTHWLPIPVPPRIKDNKK